MAERKIHKMAARVGTEIRRKSVTEVSNLENRRPKGSKTIDILKKHA